jgi:DNA-binding transcriptional ArsR family regulator
MERLDLKPYREQIVSAAEVMRAAGHPLRLRILELLCESDTRYSDIATKLKIGDSLAGKHLNILWSAGLIVRYNVPSKKTRMVMYGRSPKLNHGFLGAVKRISLVK